MASVTNTAPNATAVATPATVPTAEVPTATAVPAGVEATSPVAAPASTTVPLDAATDELLGAVEGFREGLDLMVRGAEMLMREDLTRDDTAALLAALGGAADGRDFFAVLGTALFGRLTNPDTNPCLKELGSAERENVRRIGYDIGTDLETTAPRDLVAEVCAAIEGTDGGDCR